MISKFRYFNDPPYYGEDGFGDANLPSIPTRVQAEHAIDAIIRLAEEYRGNGCNN
jgi:inosine-uridine nucleoside N-ribohydrolase